MIDLEFYRDWETAGGEIGMYGPIHPISYLHNGHDLDTVMMRVINGFLESEGVVSDPEAELAEAVRLGYLPADDGEDVF